MSAKTLPRRRAALPVIGLTGGVGSGKTQVAEFFRAWDGVLISGDEIGRVVLDSSVSVRRKLAGEFGPEVLRRGRVNRQRLAELAFASEESILRLNAIVHPPLIRELNRQVAQARRSTRHSAVIIDAALLAEWGAGRIHWDALVGVWAPMRLRRQWMHRRGWTDAEINARVRRQMPWTERKTFVDCVVKNDSSLSVLERRARHCWKKIVS